MRCNGHALWFTRKSRRISLPCCAFSLLCRVRRPEAQRCVKLCTAGLDLFLHLVRHWWYLTRDCFDSRSYQHSFKTLKKTSEMNLSGYSDHTKWIISMEKYFSMDHEVLDAVWTGGRWVVYSGHSHLAPVSASQGTTSLPCGQPRHSKMLTASARPNLP